ncbi:MAG: ATP phosphoribosyltransferase regulatory subunit [Clostridia bacterium]|nr:ATP phosphoribosyltransferase regulatory subunit [Clostridia bacterium]
METTGSLLRRDERVTLALRSLYEQYGYKKFRMNRFEAYDFYAAYRDFLGSSHVLTFTGLDGRLMALRPDVTLSIAKKVKADSAGTERLYYSEPVYRPARDAAEYCETYQVGVEHIGDGTFYTSVELISLAVQSLQLISADAVLDLSHTGYIGGLLAGLPVDESMRRAIRRCMEQKNAHELRDILPRNLQPADIERLLAVARLSGPFPESLEQAALFASGPEMLAAVEELDTLAKALSVLGQASPLRLDFSITCNAKYYSGLMMRGYIDGVPGTVLSGGRYDPLLRRMGKPDVSAMGFAIYFDGLARFLSQEVDSAVETVVLYSLDADPAAVAKAVQDCTARGERVWAGTALPEGLTWTRLVEVGRDV